jgi:hypothetical protein
MTRKPIYASNMTAHEKVTRSRYIEKSEKQGKELEEVEGYNVFRPELEAREFVDKLVEANGKLSVVVRRMFPAYKERTVAECEVKGQRMLKGSRVQELVQEALNAKKVSVDGIVSDVYEVSKSAAKDADKLRALELLAKFKQMFGPSIGSVNYNLNLSEDAATRLLERRQKFNVGPGGTFSGVRETEDGGEERVGGDVIDGQEVID